MNKNFDDLFEGRCDYQNDVLFQCETRHNAESTALHCLHTNGYQVVNHPFPCSPSRANYLSTNHGEVAVIALHVICLTRLDPGVDPESFKTVCSRIVFSLLAYTVILIYHPPM